MVAEIEARKSRLTCRLTLTYRAVFVLSECSHSPSGTRRAGQNSGSQTGRRAASSLRERVKSPCASSSTTVSIRTDEKDARSSRAGREKNSDSSGGCGRTETTLPFSLSLAFDCPVRPALSRTRTSLPEIFVTEEKTERKKCKENYTTSDDKRGRRAPRRSA